MMSLLPRKHGDLVPQQEDTQLLKWTRHQIRHINGLQAHEKV